MIDHIQLISVGDMIEAINGQSLLGCRHYEVARLLKELPRGRTFTLKLTEPRKAFGEGLLPTPLPAATPHPMPAPARSTKGHQQVVPKAQLVVTVRKGVGQPHPFCGETGRGCWLSAQLRRRMEARRKLPPHLASRNH